MGESTFDKMYRREELLWGSEADRFLIERIGKLDPEGWVLDLGCGEGRNLLFLAREGYRAIGIDFSQVALDKLLVLASEIGVQERVRVIRADIRRVELEDLYYTLIIAATVMPFMRKSDCLSVIQKIRRAASPGCFIYLAGFTIQDNTYQAYREHLGRKVDNTYWMPHLNLHQFWFEKNELRQLFSGDEIIEYLETEIHLPPLTDPVTGEVSERDFHECLLLARVRDYRES